MIKLRWSRTKVNSIFTVLLTSQWKRNICQEKTSFFTQVSLKYKSATFYICVVST